MRTFLVIAAIAIMSGCSTTHVTPGGLAKLVSIDRAEIAKEIARELIDQKRVEADEQAFKQLMPALRKTWDGIAQQYGE